MSDLAADRHAWQQYLSDRREYDRTYEPFSDDYWTPPPARPARWWAHPDAETRRSVECPPPFNGRAWEPAEGFGCE